MSTSEDQILSLAWSRTVGDDTFIYAKQLPQLIDNICSIIQAASSTAVEVVSSNGMKVITTFAKNNENYKIYKHNFSDLFDGLVGTSFTSVLKKIPYNSDKLNSVNVDPQTPLRGELDQLRRVNRKLEFENGYKDNVIKNIDSVSSESADKRLLTKLNEQIMRLQEDILLKDSVIGKKDGELQSLSNELRDLKHKYKNLKHEFDHYKKTNDKGVSKEGEFIANELRRKLRQQNELIEYLNKVTEKREDTEKLKQIYRHNDQRNSLWIYISLLVIAVIIIVYVKKSSSQQESVPKLQLRWWENYSILSSIVWFLKDTGKREAFPDVDLHDVLRELNHI